MNEQELSHYIVSQQGVLVFDGNYGICYKALQDKKNVLTIQYIGMDAKKYTLPFDTCRLLHQYMQCLAGEINNWEASTSQSLLL